MKRELMLMAVALGVLAAAGPAAAQNSAEAAAIERARIAEQRIRAEAALRARQEGEEAQTGTGDAGTATTSAPPLDTSPSSGSLSAQPQATARAPQQAGAGSYTARPQSYRSPPAPVAASTPNVTSASRTSRTLEQLRALGELWDAGYVTDEEFVRIKQRIMDGEF